MIQSFTLHIPSTSNFIESTKQIIYDISKGVKQKGGSLWLVPSTDVLPCPLPITDLENFPEEKVSFKKYFRTTRTHTGIDKFDGHIIQINCICLITTLEIKDLVLPFLQKYQFWMDSQDIYKDSYSNFFWIKGAHAKCTYRNTIISTLVNKISTAAKFDPNQFPPQQRNETDNNQSTTATSIDIDVETEGSDETNPLELSVEEHNLLMECATRDDRFTLRVHPRKVDFSYNNTSYLTNSLVVTICNKYRNVIWKIISSLPCDCLWGP